MFSTEIKKLINEQKAFVLWPNIELIFGTFTLTDFTQKRIQMLTRCF